MPKKIKFESFKSQFLTHLEKIQNSNKENSNLQELSKNLIFEYQGKEVIIKFGLDYKNKKIEKLENFKFYERGDLSNESDEKFLFVDENVDYNKSEFKKLIFKMTEMIKVVNGRNTN